MIEYIKIFIVIICFICILSIWGYITCKALYAMIADYLKPKYRRNKETNDIEYYHPKYGYWFKLYCWDKNDSERNIILCLANNDITIKYNGPGRSVFKFDNDRGQKYWREYFGYKNLKELHKQQMEYINNEDIITSKIIYERLSKNEI